LNSKKMVKDRKL